MNVKEFATKLRKKVISIKDGGSNTISCDGLITCLDKIIETPSGSISETDLMKCQANINLHLEYEKARHLDDIEMFRSVIQAGQNAIRVSFLMNGGASVAVLAFMGKLTDRQADKIPDFAFSLVCFVVGIVLMAVVSGVTYLGQSSYSRGKDSWGDRSNILAVVLVFASWVTFAIGMCSASNAFLSF